MKGFTTNAIHTPLSHKDPHGTLRSPVYDNVAFEFETAKDIQMAFEGKRPGHLYSRISNPTVEDFENRVKRVSGANGVLAVSSGMAAISNLVLTLLKSGKNVVTSRFLFGNTYSLFERTLKPWGLEVRYVDFEKPKTLDESIDENTGMVFLETITNPQLQVVDIGAIAEIAHRRGVPVVADTTVTSLYLFDSKKFGVDVEVLSSTKVISGGATSVGGLIIDNGIFDWERNSKLADWAKRYGPHALILYLRREVYRNIGACMAPHHAYLQSLGLETVSLRVERSAANALAIAKFLETHSKISRVNYPGLKSSPWHENAKKLFPRGFGGILCIELESKEKCFEFMNKLNVIRRATNINDNKTLVIHPASTIFCEYTPEERAKMGVPDTLIRLSVGIEDVEDLIDDIEKGLS